MKYGMKHLCQWDAGQRNQCGIVWQRNLAIQAQNLIFKCSTPLEKTLGQRLKSFDRLIRVVQLLCKVLSPALQLAHGRCILFLQLTKVFHEHNL